MSLMSKLSAAILLSSLSLFGATNAEVTSFLQKQIGGNKNVSNLKITVSSRAAVKEFKGWDSVIVNLTARVKQGKQERDIDQQMIYFVHGDLITKELNNVKTGRPLSSTVTPKFKAEFYTEENLVYGSSTAKHMVAIISDPISPFCRNLVQKTRHLMKNNPK